MALSPFARGAVWEVNLDPTVGSEIRKTRPCVIVSPNVLNEHWRTVIIAPMTTANNVYPFRIESEFGGRTGLIVLDQLKTVDKRRCLRRLGALDEATMSDVMAALVDMFSS